MINDDQSKTQIANEQDNRTLTVKCKFCGSQDYIKKGLRTTDNRGKIQKYYCRNCHKYFTADLGFYRMRNSEAKITAGIDLYFSSLSSRKVRNFFRRHLEHNSSHISILNWCRKYALKVQNYTDTLTPQLSGLFYADETMIDCQRRQDALWCNVDWETRFIGGFHYSTTRNEKEAITFLEKATKDERLPKYIQTDAAQFYPKAMKKLYYSNKLKGLKVEHRIVNTQRTRKYNVRIETVFMKIRDRVNNFRGLKALWSAPILLSGIVLQHNFIEEHTTLRDYPCERAGLNLRLGQNRWLNLIRLSSINK
ncbi:DDE domain protein [Candidatus Tiddalikarchaeum anstoanum]|nr:DDE domain protein [Candidatus Tiddalikarchaeum anstoanum]